MIDIREYAKQVDEGERLSKELHLMTVERDKLKKVLRDIAVINSGSSDWQTANKIQEIFEDAAT